MKIVERNIKDLIFAEYNPRRLTTEQYENLKASLLRFGFVDPIIVNTHKDRKNIIIGGHQRVKVWKDLGNKTVPCVEASLPIEKERELNIRLNKNNGEWDWNILANQFEVNDLLEWGFNENELQTVDSIERIDDIGEIEPWTLEETYKPFWMVIRGPIDKVHEVNEIIKDIESLTIISSIQGEKE